MSRPESWKLTRSRKEHFSEADMSVLRKGFRDDRTATDVARELQCSKRSVYIHFSRLRGPELDGRRRGATAKREPAPKAKASRFYRSDFQPT